MQNTPSKQSPPRLPFAILRALLPRAERDEVLDDIASEYHDREATQGLSHAKRWLWQQAVGSAPSLLRWNSRRGVTGFEPRANNYSPGGPMLKYLITDIRYAARRLIARPGYSIVAIATLSLGIGGTAAVFGIARPLIFDALPFANEKSVTTFWFGGSWTEQEFVYLRGKFPGYKSVATYRSGDVTLRDGDAPARLLSGIASSSELFDVLGARPLFGRGFQAGDDAIGAEPVAVLSYGLWNELGAKQNIVGTRITLDGTPRTVVGVMPRGFWFPSPSVRIWLPRPLNPEGQNGSFTLVGLVATGQNANNMSAQVAQLVRMLGERFKYDAEWDKTKNAAVTPIRRELLGSMQPALAATFIAMALILLIACTNVAALMLGQMEERAPELAVRAALGANRKRLTQPLVVEALLVGLAAGITGAVGAALGFGFLARALPLGAWSESASFDWTLFVVALAIAVVAVLLVVLIPGAKLLRQDARGDIYGALSRARTSGVNNGGVRAERALVIAEVALAMLIASGAALLVHSVSNLYAIHPGIEPAGVGVIDVVANGDVRAERQVALTKLVDALGALPGVQSSAAAMKIPLRGNGNNFGITIEGKSNVETGSTFFRVGTIDYFSTMGIKLKAGRLFDVSDRPDSTEVAIVVNEALAKKFFPNQDPLGRRVGGGFGVPQRIIGVVADATEGNLTDAPKPARYYLWGQVAWMGPAATLVFRTSRPAELEALLDVARKTVNSVAPAFAVQDVTTMNRVLDRAVGPARQIMSLLALLSGLALLLGAVGIYGVMAHFASRRKRDWAIRVALGLPGHRVITNIIAQGVALLTAGIAIGAVATLALSQFLSSFLFGVTGIDGLAFVGASAAVMLAGLVAAFIPARRAGTVDPALVLREQ